MAVQKRLVNWLFKRIEYILENKIDKIFKKKVLKDSRQGLAGMVFSKSWGCDEDIIFISAAKCRHANKDHAAETLAHEVLHILMPEVGERYILQLEVIVWQLLTKEQKQKIKSFIPKHTVKRKTKK